MISLIQSRQFVSVILLVAFMATLVPQIASAQFGARDGGRPGAGVDFCENLDDAEETALARMEEKKGGMDKREEMESKKTERLAELETKREAKDAEREERYEAMKEAATTDAQEEAVDTFKDTVEDLLDDRREAMDAAIDAFEAEVEDLIGDRDETIEDAADAFKDSISAVFADAGEACDDGDSSDDVRTQFMADMKELRESAKASRGEYSFKDELSEARETRKAAMDAAKDTFLEGVAAAKETLRSAFAEQQEFCLLKNRGLGRGFLVEVVHYIFEVSYNTFFIHMYIFQFVEFASVS